MDRIHRRRICTPIACVLHTPRRAANNLAGVANLSMIRSFRFTGVLVTAVLLAAAWFYWRPSTPPANGGGEAQVRGWHLTAAIRTDLKSFNSLIAADETR